MLNIRQSFKTGLNFGLTSGVITTLGLMIGLSSSTHLKSIVIDGVLILAIADSLSDALGIHISEESDKQRSQKEIWEATLTTVFAKLITCLSFLVPLWFLELSSAVTMGIIWGLFLIVIATYYLARQRNANPMPLIFEHIFIAVLVIISTNYIGNLIPSLFK